MKNLTVRLPADLVNQIESEARCRGLSKSDVVRERLMHPRKLIGPTPATLDSIADLVGSVDELPSDLSRHAKRYLKHKIRDDKRAH